MDQKQPFVHLHVHSYYSILDGYASVEGIVNKAIDDGMPAVALTDHGAMYGIKSFYNLVNKKNAGLNAEIKDKEKEIKALRESGDLSDEQTEELKSLEKEVERLCSQRFKPIIGCEGYCARRSRHDKSSTEPDPLRPTRKIDASGWHIILLAKNQQGYKNLIKIVSLSWSEGFYHRPRIDKELLEKYHEGLIITSACLGGEIPQRILAGDIEGAEESIIWFKNLFGDDYYLELQRHKASNPTGNAQTYEYQQRVNAIILELAKKHGVKVIATNDSHFLNREDAEAHERLICLSTGRTLDDPDRKMLYSKEEWFKTTEEMNEVFSDLPETLRNTVEIANKVEFYSIDSAPLMPNFPIPEGFESADEYLRYLTYKGAEERYPDLNKEVRERIDFELETISRMGFPGYFLIVQDFIAAGRQMGVLVGPGRGSAAGSAVAYCLGITNLDPIKYDLLFERFLNPDRISMPDVDIDFDDDGRADVIRWVTEKYGADCVARIITYGTMAAKGSVKDVARVQNLPLDESNRLTKLIPDKLAGVDKPKLKDFINGVPKLKEASLSTNPVLADTLKYAQQLEGTVRNVGVHACGVIIGREPISNIVPVMMSEDKALGEKVITTQYEGSVIEETGLIKMDFLGLKTLSIIKEALANIKERHNLDIDIEKIALDDEKTFALYQAGDTIGTFQFESAGMQKHLRDLKPTCFEDLIAMNALYRPGPMKYIPNFIKRKHGEEAITYDLPEMERYLKDTYGVTVYQEQVMLLSRELAGFTRGESDNLRKVMGKKIKSKLPALKVKFLEGGKAKGHKVSTLEKIWADWEDFASYAFNKSHATCYSWVAYQTAWLKANYPSEYMAGNLSRNLNDIKELTKLMGEAKRMNVRVLVPDVNESRYKFSVNSNNDIRFGLAGIKGVGSKAVEDIILERKTNGAFRDVYDFFERVNLKSCNKKTLEALVHAGAFDSFGLEREVYLMTMPQANNNSFLAELTTYGLNVQEDASDSFALFSDDEAMQIAKPEPPHLEGEINMFARLEAEKEVNGLYLSGNPLSDYQVILDYYCNFSCLLLQENLENIPVSTGVIVAGRITKTYHGTTAKGDPYGRFTIEDYSGAYDHILFGKAYLDFKPMLEIGLFVIIHGVIAQRRYRGRNGEMQDLVINRLELLSSVKDSLINSINLSIPVEDLNPELVAELSDVLENNKGFAVLNIEIADTRQGYSVNYEYKKSGVNPSLEFVQFVEKKIDFAPKEEEIVSDDYDYSSDEQDEFASSTSSLPFDTSSFGWKLSMRS